MKTNYYKTVLYSLLLCLFISLYGNAQEAERVINKNFPLVSNGTLSLSNSYGNLTLNHWDKEEVSIQVNILVKGVVKNVQKNFWKIFRLTLKPPTKG